MTAQDQVQPIEKFRELVRKFDVAMLVSVDQGGQLHARPMRIASDRKDGTDDLWFVTAVDSGKVTEVIADPRIAVTLSDGKRFLAINGEGRVVTDRAKIEDMWQESWKLWFPEGSKSERVALIQFRPTRAEYWDQSLPNGIRFAIEAAKAWLGDRKINEPDSPDQHAKVQLG